MIEKMNTHYSMTNPASIYDEEALTSLELVGRTTAKVNEVVEAQNTLASQTLEALESQDAEINNHKDVVIPQVVSAEVQKQIVNGTFDKQIDKSLNNLNDRVDNLLGSVTEGSTTLDAEVIDARVDKDGNTHTNLGEHIRKITTELSTPKFFESDVVKANYETLLEQTYLEREYDGVGTYAQFQTEPFTLEEGEYCLVVPYSNAITLTLFDNADNLNRIFTRNNVEGLHYFTITSAFAGIPLRISFNASGKTPNESGLYYAGFYLFKTKIGVPIIPEVIHSKSGARLLETDIVAQHHKNLIEYEGNLEYDGLTTFTGIRTPNFNLEAGNYTLIIPDTNFKGVYILSEDDPSLRIYGKYVVDGTIEGVHKFSITEAQATLRLNLQFNASGSTLSEAGTYFVKTPYLFKDNGKPLLPDYITRYDEVAALIEERFNDAVTGSFTKDGYLVAKADTVTSGMLEIESTVNVKKNKTLIFTGNITTFNGLRVGHGKTSYGGSYIEVDSTNIKVYSHTTSTVLNKTIPHGLTFKDFITVVVSAGIDTAKITLFTSTGMFTSEEVSWSGCNGTIFAEPLSTTLTSCELKWTTSDINKPVWVFGDSYLGLSTPARYPYYLLSMGFDNFLACGFAGGYSSAELESLKTLLTLGRPETIVWCLGMNNGDTGAINPSWLSCLEEVKALCDTYSIELILATIPSCPIVDNTYKNNYVRTSGYRYVDFNKAVVVEGTTWIEGTLHSDNVHPTELGAKILANRFIVDVPEITV